MSADGVIAFTSRSCRTMADGTLRLQIDIEPGDAQAAFALFGQPGVGGAVVRLTQEAAQAAGQQRMVQHAEKPYGEQAKALKLSSFFRTPDVWRAVGSDAAFLEWLKGQKCAARSGQCHGDVVPAHVRRVANGSGTGFKPPYSAIPLCDAHHRLQHQQGESALGGKEWFDKQRIRYVQAWAWQTLKTQLGYESWASVPPRELYVWAERHGLQVLLPECYREGV